MCNKTRISHAWVRADYYKAVLQRLQSAAKSRVCNSICFKYVDFRSKVPCSCVSPSSHLHLEPTTMPICLTLCTDSPQAQFIWNLNRH